MDSDLKQARKVWKDRLPHSKMAYPERAAHILKYHFWRVYTPFHPYIRDLALSLGIVKHEGRSERFPVGSIAPHSSIDKVVEYLIAQGYAYHKVAWEDEGEIVGLRKVVNFEFQYHIRIYVDGEVRGHYEFTPESYPLLHLYEVGQEERREEFLELLKEHIIEYKLDDRG